MVSLWLKHFFHASWMKGMDYFTSQDSMTLNLSWQYSVKEHILNRYLILSNFWQNSYYGKKICFWCHSKLTETIRNHPQPSGNHLEPLTSNPKSSEATWNYLKPPQNFQKLGITSYIPLEPLATQPCNKPSILILFLLLNFNMNWWSGKLGKDNENSSNDHEP